MVATMLRLLGVSCAVVLGLMVATAGATFFSPLAKHARVAYAPTTSARYGEGLIVRNPGSCEAVPLAPGNTTAEVPFMSRLSLKRFKVPENGWVEIAVKSSEPSEVWEHEVPPMPSEQYKKTYLCPEPLDINQAEYERVAYADAVTGTERITPCKWAERHGKSGKRPLSRKSVPDDQVETTLHLPAGYHTVYVRVISNEGFMLAQDIMQLHVESFNELSGYVQMADDKAKELRDKKKERMEDSMQAAKTGFYPDGSPVPEKKRERMIDHARKMADKYQALADKFAQNEHMDEEKKAQMVSKFLERAEEHRAGIPDDLDGDSAGRRLLDVRKPDRLEDVEGFFGSGRETRVDPELEGNLWMRELDRLDGSMWDEEFLELYRNKANKGKRDMHSAQSTMRKVLKNHTPKHKSLAAFHDEWMDTRLKAIIDKRDMLEFGKVLNYVAPGLYTVQVFNPTFCELLVDEIKHAMGMVNSPDFNFTETLSQSGVGFVLEELGMSASVKNMIERVMVPLAAAALYDYGGATLDTYHAFTTSYEKGGEERLRRHMDLSDVTLNVNLGMEGYTGAEVFFQGIRGTGFETKNIATMQQTMGQGILHVGQMWHGMHKIETGARHNLVLWARSSEFRASASEAFAWQCGSHRRWGNVKKMRDRLAKEELR